MVQLLLGDSVAGDHNGDCGMRNFRSAVGVRAEVGGRMYGEGGMMGAEAAVFKGGGTSCVLQVQLAALLGCVRGVDLPE